MPANCPTAARQSGWSRGRRGWVSLLILAHVMAVVVPPLAFQANGPLGLAPSVATVMQWVRPYAQFMYLDRGYAFFAPDPGPSHLIQAGITDPSGTLTEVVFPDLDRQWPRLLYHRHFMLAEFLNEIHRPPGPPPELIQQDPQGAQAWREARSRYEHTRASFVRHLESRYPGQRVAIRRLEHAIPDVVSFADESLDLNDPRLFRVLLDDPPPLEPAVQPLVTVGRSDTTSALTEDHPDAPSETSPPESTEGLVP